MVHGRGTKHYVVVGALSLLSAGCGLFDSNYTPVSDHKILDPELAEEASAMIGDKKYDPSYRVDWALSQNQYQRAKDICLDNSVWTDPNEKFRHMQKVDEKKCD